MKVQKARTVDPANIIRPRDAITFPAPPKADLNAVIASVEPASPVCHTPVQRITSAVKVQTTMVSKNTSNTPHMPCFTGSVSEDWAYAIEDCPLPASEE